VAAWGGHGCCWLLASQWKSLPTLTAGLLMATVRRMSWSGIYLVHVPDGVTPQQAVDATVVGWLASPHVRGSHLMALSDPVEVEPDPDFRARARDVVMSVNPLLAPRDDGGLDDGIGPVVIYIYAVEVQLLPKRRWNDPEDVDGFAVMWDYCVALGEGANCVAQDPDEDELIDLSLELWEARRRYNWV